MLDQISVNTLSAPRPGSATLPRRQFGAMSSHTNTEPCESVFLNNDKIILPLKEYSNKFLRENKPREQLLYNHSILRPKKSFIYSRKEIKHRRNRQRQVLDKENQGRAVKTESSQPSNTHQSFVQPGPQKEKTWTPSTPMDRCASTKNRMERISTSRALEMFSKVFKNESIERMKIRKQVINKTSDVQVRQVTLQDKQDKKARLNFVGVAKPRHIYSSSLMPKQTKSKLLFAQDQNFELAGW